jgi:hypothetical protein
METEVTGGLFLEQRHLPLRTPSHNILEPQPEIAWQSVGQTNRMDVRETITRTSLWEKEAEQY